MGFFTKKRDFTLPIAGLILLKRSSLVDLSNHFHVDGRPLEKFYQELAAPLGKDFVWYENSSHMFHPEDATSIETYVIEFSKNKTEVYV